MRRNRISSLDRHKRLNEIAQVLRENEISKGMTPDKLCDILEELGPTFIKLGQLLSMRSDFLPQEYCDALKRLQSDVNPMPSEKVKELLEAAYGRPLEDVFARFDMQALGSASIAQVHAAQLPTGEDVVVKIQREGIHEVMSRDIQLLRKAAELVKYTPVKGLVDFNRLLDEMWIVAQQEMNFTVEARNLSSFQRLNADVAFVAAPEVYEAYCTPTILVMERIDGIGIVEKDSLLTAGYDLAETGAKLLDNYLKQILFDGFFHADPHPGNLRIREGKIIFLDMGMMGTIGVRERKQICNAIEGIMQNNLDLCLDAVLGLAEVSGEVNRAELRQDCIELLDKYSSMNLGSISLSEAINDVTEIMRKHHLAMPANLAMLARGLATMEGVVADLAPDVPAGTIAMSRISRGIFRDFDLKGAVTRDARAVYESAYKALGIPALISDTLQNVLDGEASAQITHEPGLKSRQQTDKNITRCCLTAIMVSLILAAGLILAPSLNRTEAVCTACGCLIAAVICAIMVFISTRKSTG